MLDVPHPRLGLLELLRRELLLCRELGLDLGDARVLGLDHFFLVAHLPLALLEVDLELGQLGLASVQVGGPVRELFLEAHAAVVGGALLVEAAA